MSSIINGKQFAYKDRLHWWNHNWLVYRIHDIALEKIVELYAEGILVDIGCGEKPYEETLHPYVKEHIGVDHLDTLHSKDGIDVIGTAYNTTLANEIADTILCTAVLEHLENPSDAIKEMFRILKVGGHVILSTPQFWHLHEEPRDFYRYTRFGLEYLFKKNGFDIVKVIPLSGFFVTFFQEFSYLINPYRRWPIRILIISIQFLIQWFAYQINRWDRSYKYTWMNLIVAKKSLDNNEYK